MWVSTQSECSIVLVACKAAVAALQVVEAEGGVTLTGPSVQSLLFNISTLLPAAHIFVHFFISASALFQLSMFLVQIDDPSLYFHDVVL
jgi:hypothetical protein